MNIELFTSAERTVIAAAINRCGDGQHPIASAETLRYFTSDYVSECLTKALPKLNALHAQPARRALEKLNS